MDTLSDQSTNFSFAVSTVLDMIRRKLDEASDVEIEIRKAPKRSNGTAYISLTPIGVKPGDKIIVVTTKDLLIVSKWG